MGERDLARPWGAPSANEPRGRDRVMRCPEWPRVRKFAAADPRHTVNSGDLQGLLKGRRRQDAGEPAGEHGLPGSGWTDHEEVVAARGGDLQRPARIELAVHVG